VSSVRYGRPETWARLADLDGLLNRVWNSPRFSIAQRRSWRRIILMLLFAKGLKTHRALQILGSQGYGEDAIVLLRSLFQVVVTAQYLVGNDSRTRFARYRAYHAVPLAVAAAKNPKVSLPVAKLEANARRAKNRFKFSSGAFGWAGISLEAAAKEVGQQGVYDSLYRVGSQYEHTMFWSIVSFADRGTVFQASRDPSGAHVDKVLASSYSEILILSEVVIRSFSLGMVKELHPLLTLPGSFVFGASAT